MNPGKNLSRNRKFESAVYTGTIRHRRFEPCSHEFEYPIFMLYLDLDELPALFKQKWFCSLEHFNVVSFKRSDYFCPEDPDLKHAVINKVESESHSPETIKHVRVLLHARYLNATFNPVVFYYCFDDKQKLIAILAEITNTPWGERHHYVLPINSITPDSATPAKGYAEKGQNKHQFEFSKAFHVSPFNPMNMDYRWVFSEPGNALLVHMDNLMQQETTEPSAHESVKQKHFDATLKLERHSFESEFSKILIQYPFMTVKVVLGIYWHAFRLWLKKAPFYDHP